MSVIRIEDEDGFETEWPWPDNRLMIANTDFLGLCERQHDEQRARWLSTREDRA